MPKSSKNQNSDNPAEQEVPEWKRHRQLLLENFRRASGDDSGYTPVFRLMLGHVYDMYSPTADPVLLAMANETGKVAFNDVDGYRAAKRRELRTLINNSVGASKNTNLWLNQTFCRPDYAAKLASLPNASSYWDGYVISPSYTDSMNNLPLTLFPGVTAVLGKSGAGKTQFVTNHLLVPLSNRDDLSQVHYWSVKEPDGKHVWNLIKDNIPQNVDVYTVCDTEADFARGLFELVYIEPELREEYTPRVAIFDSSRYLFFSSTAGSFGKGGVSNTFFIALTELDKFAQDTLTHIVVTLNPLTDSDTAISTYLEQLTGTVSNVIHCTDKDIKFYSRFLDRSELTFKRSSRVFGEHVRNVHTSSPNISPDCFFYNEIGGTNG